MPVDQSCLGRILRDMREQRQLSQEGLAALSDLSRTHIGEIERGVVSLSLASLFMVADGLGCSVSEVLLEYEARIRSQTAGCSQAAG